MAEKKAVNESSRVRSQSKAKTKKQTSKRRGQNAQDLDGKIPSKAALKQMAKDWDQVT